MDTVKMDTDSQNSINSNWPPFTTPPEQKLDVKPEPEIKEFIPEPLNTTMETNPTLCLICSREKATPVTVPENFDFLKLLCKTLNFPTIVPLLTELRIPIPNCLFCVDCSEVIRASRDVLNKISILEEELERLRQQLKKCIVSSGGENSGPIELGRKELNTGPFIRKLFVQCWSDCRVDVVRIPVHAGIEIGIPERGPSESLSRTRRSGRPRKVCTDVNVAVDAVTVDAEEDLERRSNTWDDIEPFDPNEFLVISEEDPDVEEELESDTSEEYSMKKREKVKSKHRRKIKGRKDPEDEGVQRRRRSRKDPEHGGVRRKRGRKDGEDEGVRRKKKDASDKPFVCPECGKGYRSQEYYDAHMMSHTGDLGFTCEFCGKKFAMKQHLHVHNRQVHDVVTSSKSTPGDKCQYCGLSFLPDGKLGKASDAGQVEDMTTVYNNDVETKEVAKEEVQSGDQPVENISNGSPSNNERGNAGGVTVWTDKKKRAHMRGCSENPRVKYKNETVECRIPCGHCEKVFTTIVALQFHVASIHKKTFKFYCEICARGFQVLSHLQRHIDGVHEMVKKYECEICHVKFKRSHQLLYHKRKHTGELPFICEFCGKGFHVAEKLRRHAHIHSEVNRYPCHICGKLFKSHHYRHNHISTTHFGSRRGRQHKKKSDSETSPPTTIPIAAETPLIVNSNVPSFGMPEQLYFGS